jgi:hypothetical protein
MGQRPQPSTPKFIFAFNNHNGESPFAASDGADIA